MLDGGARKSICDSAPIPTNTYEEVLKSLTLFIDALDMTIKCTGPNRALAPPRVCRALETCGSVRTTPIF